MTKSAYCLFETPLGLCGIGWSDQGYPGPEISVTAFQLPEANAAETEARISRKCGARNSSAPPQQIGEIIRRVRQHLEGAAQDFRDVIVELGTIGEFAARVYQATREIPAGQTATYGELARALGQPGSARAVGQALGKNPIPLIIPCHRVLAAGGKPGGFSAYGGRATKAKMLAIEGAKSSVGEIPRTQPSSLYLWSLMEREESPAARKQRDI